MKVFNKNYFIASFPVFLLCLAFCSLTSCQDNNGIPKPSSDDCRPITMTNGVVPDDHGRIHTMIDKAVIKDDCLYIETGYSGCGNRSKDFRLTWNGSMSKSLPPLVSLQLKDTLTHATCEMYVKDILRYDLSLIRDANKSSGEVRIQIDGFKEELIYKY